MTWELDKDRAGPAGTTKVYRFRQCYVGVMEVNVMTAPYLWVELPERVSRSFLRQLMGSIDALQEKIGPLVLAEGEGAVGRKRLAKLGFVPLYEDGERTIMLRELSK